MAPLLDDINGPEDLKPLGEDELQQVAQEVRDYIIDTVGEIGGHFGANLGTCELAVALHSVLESPRDKILWDVGHQAYPHKVLTGRRDELPTIRKYGGLAPFCSREESPHDIMGAGHASTAASYAVGIKEAMRRWDQIRAEGGPGSEQGEPHGEAERRARHVVAVVGDGAMTGGVNFEALLNAGGLETPVVIVLNDNGMSISPNVGALSRYFNRLRLNPRGWQAREAVEAGLTRLPAGIGERIERLGPQLKESIKAFWAPGLFFEELDLAYVGVIDGHDVKALRRALTQALGANRPVVVHIKTVKGKGFAPAEDGGLEGMEKWHAAKPGSIEKGGRLAGGKAPAVTGSTPVTPPQYTEVFGHALVEEARRDPRVIGITAAMAGGTGLSELARELPDHYYDVGIAEQHAVLFAAGLALEGMKPVCAIYSTFLQRAYDQIIHDVCLQRLNVVFAMDRAGLVGDDGPTHHGSYDISYLRALPNMVVMAPRDEAMLVHMLRTALVQDGPVALRYPRGAAVGVPLPERPTEIRIGTGETLVQGERVALIGYGTGVRLALDVAAVLRPCGVDATVCDARFAKPLDRELLHSLTASHDLLVTIEENVLAGGFGSAVLEHLSDSGTLTAGPAVIRFGLPDRYVTHGKPALLHDEVGLTAERIAERVQGALDRPRDIAQRVVMGTDIGQWAVQVLEHGLPPLPAQLERGETVPAAVWRDDHVGGVLFVRLWKDGQPDSEVAIARRAADGVWDVPSWGGGPWVDDPMMRPADGWDGDPVVWLHHSGQFTQGDKDGVRAQAGAAADGIAAIRVEQAGRTWSVPVDSPCGAFVVVMDSLRPARLCAIDERGAEAGACVELEDISDLMRHEWWPELPAEGTPMVRYDFQPAADE